METVYRNYLDLPQKPVISGIYGIRRIETGDCYYGSAINIATRWRGHMTDLRRGKHNRILQFAWNKHGPEAFEFVIMELVEVISDDVSRLMQREFYYLNLPEAKYNAMKITAPGPGMYPAQRVGLKDNPETVRKRKESYYKTTQNPDWNHPSKDIPRTEEVKDKIRVTNTGKIRSDETKSRQVESQNAYIERLKAEGKPHHNKGMVWKEEWVAGLKATKQRKEVERRAAGIPHHSKGSKYTWITNGTETIRLPEGQPRPEGFRKGRHNGPRGGKRGPDFSWATNGEVTLMVPKGTPFPDGFRKGRHNAAG